MTIHNGAGQNDNSIATLDGGRRVIRTEDRGNANYLYVDDELRVASAQLEDFFAVLGEFEVNRESCDTTPIGSTGYSSVTIRQASGSVPEIPELVDTLRSSEIDAFPHHVMALENHTQFGPHDAPLDIDKGLHPQLWAERVIVEQTLLAVTGEGNQVVVVDTGVLNDKEAPLIHRSGLGKHSEREKPKRPVNGASIPAFYGHGTFVAGKVLTANPDAVVQVFRPDGFSPVKGDSALVLTDDDLAAVLARALFVMAGEPGGPQPRLSNKERALQAEQAMTAQPDLKPAVLNLSLAGADHGVPDPLPATLEILKVWLDLGIKVVAAAGNDHTDAPHYPAAYDGVIGVGAVDRANTDADFSNYGSWVDEKRLGVNVVSAYLEGGSDRSSVKVPKPTGNPRMPHRSKTRGPWDGLASWSGTSFAAPQVAGELSI